MTEDLRGTLSPFAVGAGGPDSCGRRQHRVASDPDRSPFQRDSDRIVHSTAFRRLMHKTQVFVAPDGDHFRTRLTHTIEVARVARALAAILRLNVDLAEALALAHDLGHPPFGHAGEEALTELMSAHGGFEHNAQAIRIVAELERSYFGYDGLNLTWETLEGIAKHNGPLSGDIPHAVRRLDREFDLRLDTHASAEAQVAAIADDIAYNCHDLQDGMRAECFALEDIESLPLVRDAFRKVGESKRESDRSRFANAVLRAVFKALVNDAASETGARIKAIRPCSADDIRECGSTVAGFSGKTASELAEVRVFLRQRMYRSALMEKARSAAQQIIRDLFRHYMEEPGLLPAGWGAATAEAAAAGRRARLVGDYIAGMTDRYAIKAHVRAGFSPGDDFYRELLYAGNSG